MSVDNVEFWRLREREERAAAKRATGLSARRAHQELAVQYSLLIFDAAIQQAAETLSPRGLKLSLRRGD